MASLPDCLSLSFEQGSDLGGVGLGETLGRRTPAFCGWLSDGRVERSVLRGLPD